MSAQLTLDDLKAGMEVRGKVKKIELFGAFVDIGAETDALLHISQLGKPVRNVEDVVKSGEEITAYVLKVDKDAKRIALSLVKQPSVRWDAIKEGDELEGDVVRVENFGAFVDVGAERPGMVHVSEMADGYVKSPSDVVKVGDKVKVRVLKVDRKKRQIDLTMKAPEEKVEDIEDEDEDENEQLTAFAAALRRAMARNDDDEVETFVQRGKKKNRNNRQQDDIITRTLRQTNKK